MKMKVILTLFPCFFYQIAVPLSSKIKKSMKKKVQFTKMHGAGNDYIYVDTTRYPIEDPEQAAIAWSDRHKGIGSDGLVLIGVSPIPEADFTMRIFNADGSEAMMCGNASHTDTNPTADKVGRQDAPSPRQRRSGGECHCGYAGAPTREHRTVHSLTGT